MSKQVKTMVIDQIRKELGDSRDLLVVDASALDGVTANRVRLALQAKGVTLMGVKNALANRVLTDLGMSDMGHILAGPSTLVWGSEDIVQLSKEITKWAKEVDKLQIKGAAVDGQVLDAKGVEELSKSPGRLELLSIISGQLLSPGANLSGALLGVGGKLASQIKTMCEGAEGEDEGDAAPAAEASSAEA
ncbi:MAG: 50S ribosomal protein L10 [Planctomycetaceae bacterium]